MIEIYGVMVNKYNIVEAINTVGTHYQVMKFWYKNETIDFYRAISLLITHNRMLGEYNSTNQEMELFVFT